MGAARRGRQMPVLPPERGPRTPSTGGPGSQEDGYKGCLLPAARPADDPCQRRRAGGAANRERAPYCTIAPECTLLTLTTSRACRQGAPDVSPARPSRASRCGLQLADGARGNRRPLTSETKGAVHPQRAAGSFLHGSDCWSRFVSYEKLRSTMGSKNPNYTQSERNLLGSQGNTQQEEKRVWDACTQPCVLLQPLSGSHPPG